MIPFCLTAGYPTKSSTLAESSTFDEFNKKQNLAIERHSDDFQDQVRGLTAEASLQKGRSTKKVPASTKLTTTSTTASVPASQLRRTSRKGIGCTRHTDDLASLLQDVFRSNFDEKITFIEARPISFNTSNGINTANKDKLNTMIDLVKESSNRVIDSIAWRGVERLSLRVQQAYIINILEELIVDHGPNYARTQERILYKREPCSA
ncbi:hypothetical protein MMC21_008339 [Puttea exsequens]|nr:hypothetical protein [Puttea exsequens]